MKKILAICSALVMLAANSVCAEKIGESYFADNFENQTDWVSLAGTGWGSTNGGAVIITDGKDGKCAAISNASWGSSLNAPLPQNLSGIVGVSFDMMMNKRSVDGVYFHKQGENVPLEYLLNFQWRNNAYEIYSYGADIYNTAPVFTLQQDQWINVQMLLDLTNQKYSVSVTDESGVTKNIITNLPVPIDSTLDSIVFFNPQYALYGVADEDIGVFKLDNFDMYKDIPNESEDFEDISVINEAQGWSSTNATDVSVASEENNKYLQINSLWENRVSKVFAEPYEKNVIIEMRLKAEQPKGQFLRILTGSGDNDYKNFLCINQNENGENQLIYCYGENVWDIAPVSFESNEWFNLKIIVNNDEKTWYGYVNTDSSNNGEDQLIFWDSISDIDKIYGLQFYYPLHWNPDDDTATGKIFGIDDFNTSLFDGEVSYSMESSIITEQGKPITDKQSLLNAKEQNPAVNITVSRKTYGEMLPAYAALAVYQDGKLVSLDMDNSFALNGMNTEKTIVLNPDFSKLNTESDNIEVKAFLWQANSLTPLTAADNIFGE